MPKSNNKVPDRWLDYKSVGARIPGSKFVALKVPLSHEILCKVKKGQRFSCDDMLHHFENRNMKLGLVIDLTFTSRYYKPQFFIDNGIAHCKIYMPGRVIPDTKIYEEFQSKVQLFEKDNPAEETVIAVHCTHGVNRTGYMICRYLIEANGISACNAINVFGKARGHAIERDIYLDHLNSLHTKVIDVPRVVLHTPYNREKRQEASMKKHQMVPQCRRLENHQTQRNLYQERISWPRHPQNRNCFYEPQHFYRSSPYKSMYYGNHPRQRGNYCIRGPSGSSGMERFGEKHGQMGYNANVESIPLHLRVYNGQPSEYEMHTWNETHHCNRGESSDFTQNTYCSQTYYDPRLQSWTR